MKPHYAWAVCASCCLFVFVCIGIVTNGFSIYLPYLKDAGLSDIESSVVVSVRGVVSLVFMLGIHLFYRHINVRLGVFLAAMCTFVGYLVYSIAGNSFALYCLGSALTGISYALGAMIILSDVLRRWFHVNFGLAIGLTAAGTGFATFLIPQFVTTCVPIYGLGTTFLIEAFAILAILVVAVLMFCNDPSEKGMSPYGWDGEEAPAVETALGAGRAKLSLRIWMTLGLACLFMGVLAGPGLVFLGDLYTSSGFDKSTAALAISAIGVLMIIGKILVGRAIDRVGTYRALMVFGGVLATGLFLSLFLGGSYFLLSLSILFSGLGFSMMMVAPSNFAKDIADPSLYFPTVRNFEIIYVFGSAIFSSIPGVIAEMTNGDYAISYVMFAAMVVVSMVLMSVHYRPKGSRSVD